MKIAILLSDLTVQGGGDRQAVYLARELQEMGHDLTVYTPAFDGGCYPDVCSRLRIVVTGKHPSAALMPSRRLRAFLDMRRMARGIEDGFDVLNPHHWPPHWAAVSAARRMARRPAIVWMCNDPPWPPDAARGLSPRALLRRLFFRYDSAAVQEIDRVVVLSRYAKGILDATYGIDAAVVRSGVDIEALRLGPGGDAGEIRRRRRIPADCFLVLALGILMPHRRIEDALEAVASLLNEGRRLHLLIAGSPEQYPEYAYSLREMARRLRITEHVTFAGAVDENELKLYYHACDAFLFPNENQTWALAVIEAMACGKPVVVSRGAAVQEVLEDGKTALLVPPRDPDAIAAALRRLMDGPGLAAQVAGNGQRFVADTFSWRRYAQSMLAIFEEHVAKGVVEAAGEKAA
ncbi:MAG: glycosyltransferase family 4 protein [Dehalococcoidia bacterium]|nr:glycosyltransferase family 4 protein [Dehalococcoidia bacterium]